MKIYEMLDALRDLRAWARDNENEILYLGDEFYCKGIYTNKLCPDLLITSARCQRDAEKFLNEADKELRDLK